MKEDATVDIAEMHKRYVMGTYPATDFLLSRGKGCNVWDSAGKKYLDFCIGISVSNLGHCHPAVTKAISTQAKRLVHTSNLFLNEVQPQLAMRLIEHGFDGVCFFCNSGAEANEGLIKFARKWGSDKGRHEIIAMEDSFHGRTLATLAATGRDKYRKGFHPDMPGFRHVPFNNLAAAEAAITPQTAAMLVEPVQGEGGVIPSSDAYLQGLRKLCNEKGILLLFDEVQCGMGRTGHLYAWQSYGVEPDALSIAKAFGNGFPVGGFIVKRIHQHVLGPGTHASTFGGTPLACAAACAVIDTLTDEGLLDNTRKMGPLLLELLSDLQKRHSCVKGARGRGLLIGLVLDRPAGPLIPILRKNGLIALTAGENVLRLLPPLIVSERECRKAVSIIAKSLSEFEASTPAPS